MQNPFNHENYPSNNLKRNPFPCSFQTNLTMKYGYIYPAGIWRTIPGATYKIRPTLGLNFMPTTFPVQTRQKVYVHYFYGRDRNFWKDYKDFVNGQRPDLVKPYLDESVTKARTGKLLDYLGVPTTTIDIGFGSFVDLPIIGQTQGSFFGQMHYVDENTFADSSWYSENSFLTTTPLTKSDIVPNDDISNFFTFIVYPLSSDLILNKASKLRVQADVDSSSVNNVPIDEWLNYGSERKRKDMFHLCIFQGNELKYDILPSEASNNGVLSYDLSTVDYALSDLSAYIVLNYTFGVVPGSVTTVNFSYGSYSRACYSTSQNCHFVLSDGSFQYVGVLSASYQYQNGSPTVVDITDETSPYWRSGPTTDLRERIKLNATLPRFYETVYNLYYRNPQNNPYMLNGMPEYNKFIPTKDGGVDSNLYELRRRNWEDDFLTTAVQSPQQGIAPLVGLTDRAATLTLTNDDGSVTRYNVSVADNGSLTGIEATDTTAEPVLTKALIDAVSYGISIEDIRNVNAMQKWLELNLRKGYQYKDIIQARWGISISYNELDLPEFIGGFSRDVQLQAVTQTANVNDDVTGQLGWQGGRLFASGEGREITHYCDEEGYIMCLVTTVPVPNYSQLLAKHWIERDLLDSYQPEFNHIGFQPITYKEVCPVQAYQESTENVNVLEQTFGYQRPWYQYFNYTDEVHGQFRTTFKDFLINRVFDVKPELSESFLLVDPEQINDVFNVTDPDDDKIIGAIYHNCVAKLPISLYAQARLE